MLTHPTPLPASGQGRSAVSRSAEGRGEPRDGDATTDWVLRPEGAETSRPHEPPSPARERGQ